MVTSITSFGRSGLYDWMVQRVSAVILLAYVLFLTIFFILNPDFQYSDWQALFAGSGMRIFSLITILALCAHAWIGMWIIATDYLTPIVLGKFATGIRLVFQLGCLIILFVYFVWCIQILWGI